MSGVYAFIVDYLMTNVVYFCLTVKVKVNFCFKEVHRRMIASSVTLALYSAAFVVVGNCEGRVVVWNLQITPFGAQITADARELFRVGCHSETAD